MEVTPLKTKKIRPKEDLNTIILETLQTYTPDQLESSVLVVTSKIVSLSENAVVPIDKVDKHSLVREQAERYTLPTSSEYGVMLTIKDSILAVNAGIDESNVEDVYVLLPQDSFASAEQIWHSVCDHFSLKQFGVVITDSTSFPLKWGVVGRCLAHCGFKQLKDLRGQPDIFGRELVMTQMNIAEGVAAAAVLEMGEGASQTPLCLVKEVTHIEFQDRPPTKQELDSLKIAVEDDVYAPLLDSKLWKKNTEREQ